MILYHLQQADKALQNLEELKKFPELPQSAEGMFLAGTIAADRGDLMKSAENYLQAAVMRPAETIFSAISFGRAADSLFIIGSKTKNEKILKRSADIYASLIKNKKINSDFKLQCLYKLGRTLENLNDFQGAIDAYTEALYLPGNDGIKNAVIPIWINKSALNAINIYIRLGGSSALNDSLYIIRRLKKLNTMTQTELDSLEYNVRERYINNSQ